MNQPEEHIIKMRGLTKTFGDVQALKGVNLKVPRHSIFGFLGPNGAGKTTTMKILLGLIRPTSGAGEIFGKDIVTESLAVRERIGYLPQHPRFIEYMTARENLIFTAGFYFRGPRSRIRERCDEMLELVGLSDKADRPIKGFSGGEKQRLGIALAQVNDPDLLILDEPASSLDPIGRQAVLDIMANLRERSTVFYSTHILDDVQRVSDTVAILNKGSLVASGPIEQILNGKDGLVYSVGVKGPDDGLGNRLGELPWVKNAAVEKQSGPNLWHISVSDESEAESKLLRHILEDQRLTVTEFSRQTYELEEAFMDIIEGDSNGHRS